MMQTERLAMGPGTGTGGPKKQLASRSHAPIGVPPTHWLSALHAPVPSVPGAPFRQCRAGPAPRVQSAGPLPGSGPSASASPEIPVTARTEVPPSGMDDGGNVVAEPPPK